MSDFPHIEQALADVTDVVMAAWVGVVRGDDALPGVPPVEVDHYWVEKYVENIRIGERVDIPAAGYLRAEILCTHQIAVDLEYGRGPWDMKDMLLSGRKHKVSRKGKRYLSIPFRHGHFGDTKTVHFPQMPKDVYAAAKNLDRSLAGQGPQQMIRQSVKPGDPFGRGHGRLRGYRKGTLWGGKLTGTEAAHPPRVHEITHNKQTGAPLAKAIRYQHKSGIYEGMVKIGPPKQSQYITFRTVSDNSPADSWFHPGYKPHGIVRGVSEAMAPKVQTYLENAARLDLIDIPNLSVGMRVVRI